MSENIVVDNTVEENISLFDSLWFLGVNIACCRKTIILDYSDIYDNICKIRIPPELKDKFFPENFMVWKFSMPRRMTIVDYVTQFGILHEDLHIVVESFFKDDIHARDVNHIHRLIDSAECFVFLHSLITEMTSEDMWELNSQMYTEIEKRDHSDIPYVWVPPDMRGSYINRIYKL